MRHHQTPPKYWFSSDHHHGHVNVIKKDYCNRPFQTMTEQDHNFVEAWNSKVKPGDIGFILGDFSFYESSITTKILKSMNGQKTLIKGNHDHQKLLRETIGWSRVIPYHELRIDDDRIVLSHFPFISWHNQQRGAYHLHGHCHGNMNYPGELGKTRILDVGVDNIYKLTGQYGPLEWSEIKELLSKRKPGHSDDGHRVRRADYGYEEN